MANGDEAIDALLVGECDLIGDAAPRVGLFSHGGPDKTERWVTLQNFAMLRQ